MESKKDKRERPPTSIFVLKNTDQSIGSFDIPFFYQISGAGNPNTSPCCRQIRIPIIYDKIDISMVRVGDLIFITNTGFAVVETTSFRFTKISDLNDSLETTLTPDENIQLNPNEIALVEISWVSQPEKGEQQNIVARFTFNQDDHQIYASCEVQPIPATPVP